MSTSTITSRKSCGTFESASHDGVLREPLDDPLLVPRRPSLLEPVVEEVVALLHRLHVGRALLAAAAVDVEVREDAHEPGPEVRPRRVGAPAPEGARVGLLDEVLGLLAASRRAVVLPGRPGRTARAPPPRSGRGRGPRSAIRRASVSGSAIAPDSNKLNVPRSAAYSGRSGVERRKPRAVERREELVAVDALVVPGERDLAEEVRVGRLEPVERSPSARPSRSTHRSQRMPLHLDRLRATAITAMPM